MSVNECGPLYGVELIESLPIGMGGMLQAMPSRSDLEQAKERHARIVAGYEVLLSHYHRAAEELASLKAVTEDRDGKCGRCGRVRGGP